MNEQPMNERQFAYPPQAKHCVYVGTRQTNTSALDKNQKQLFPWNKQREGSISACGFWPFPTTGSQLRGLVDIWPINAKVKRTQKFWTFSS